MNHETKSSVRSQGRGRIKHKKSRNHIHEVKGNDDQVNKPIVPRKVYQVDAHEDKPNNSYGDNKEIPSDGFSHEYSEQNQNLEPIVIHAREITKHSLEEIYRILEESGQLSFDYQEKNQQFNQSSTTSYPLNNSCKVVIKPCKLSKDSLEEIYRILVESSQLDPDYQEKTETKTSFEAKKALQTTNEPETFSHDFIEEDGNEQIWLSSYSIPGNSISFEIEQTEESLRTFIESKLITRDSLENIFRTLGFEKPKESDKKENEHTTRRNRSNTQFPAGKTTLKRIKMQIKKRKDKLGDFSFNNLGFDELENFNVELTKGLELSLTFDVKGKPQKALLPCSYFQFPEKISFPVHIHHIEEVNDVEQEEEVDKKVKDFLDHISLFENISKEETENLDHKTIESKIKRILKRYQEVNSSLSDQQEKYLIEIPKLYDKGELDLNSDNKGNNNWITGKIRLDLFLISLIENNTFCTTLGLKENDEKERINDILMTLINGVGIRSQTSGIFPLLYAMMNGPKISNDDLKYHINRCFNSLENKVNSYITEIIKTIIRWRSIFQSMDYKTINELFFEFRFMMSNFHYPHNNFIDSITNNSETKGLQRIIFHEFIHFSKLCVLMPQVFPKNNEQNIPFLEGNYSLVDIFGNKISFAQQKSSSKIISSSGNHILEIINFNYNPNMKIMDDDSKIGYSIGNHELIYVEKEVGSTDGFIIKVRDNQQDKNAFLFCKELFCLSSQFRSIIDNRVEAIRRSKNQNSKIASHSKSAICLFSPKEYTLLYHNEPHIEVFGYKLLKVLKMCPSFILYKSSIDFKTYIMMEEIDHSHEFYSYEQMSEIVSKYGFRDIFKSMRIVHKMKMVHSLFLFNDFHDQNYAIKIEKNIVQGIQIIDLWTCHMILPVYDLTHKIEMKDSPENNLELFYRVFNEKIKETSYTSNQIYCYLTYLNFIDMLIPIYKMIGLPKSIKQGQITAQIVKEFVKLQLEEINKKELVNNELSSFVSKAYIEHVGSNINRMIQYFVESQDLVIDSLSKLSFSRLCGIVKDEVLCIKNIEYSEITQNAEKKTKVLIFLDQRTIDPITLTKEEFESHLILIYYQSNLKLQVIEIDMLCHVLEQVYKEIKVCN